MANHENIHTQRLAKKLYRELYDDNETNVIEAVVMYAYEQLLNPSTIIATYETVKACLDIQEGT